MLSIFGVDSSVNWIEWCIYVRSPPPPSVSLSLRMNVYSGMVGVLILELSLVSWTVMIFGSVFDIRWVNSVILLRMPLIFSWRILKFVDLVGVCVSLIELLVERGELEWDDCVVVDADESLGFEESFVDCDEGESFKFVESFACDNWESSVDWGDSGLWVDILLLTGRSVSGSDEVESEFWSWWFGQM